MNTPLNRNNLPTSYHWYLSNIPLPKYDLLINDSYYGFLDTPEQPLQTTPQIKYLGYFPEGQLRTYINRGYISHKKPTHVVFHEAVPFERRDV